MGTQTPMAQGRSSKIISMIKWIRTSRLSVKNCLSARPLGQAYSYCMVLFLMSEVPLYGSELPGSDDVTMSDVWSIRVKPDASGTEVPRS